MKAVRSGFRFFFVVVFLQVGVLLFQHHLLKTLSLLHCIAFALLSKINLPYLCGSISGLFSALLIFLCCQYQIILIPVDSGKR